VYCNAKDAVTIWDTILEKGARFNVIPASWDSLDLTRVEASLLFFPNDMPEGDTTPWEVNMDWCIDLDKAGDYVGKQAILNLKGRERFKQVGLVCKSNAAVEIGAKLIIEGKEVGEVTSSSYSRYLMKSLAMVHIKPEVSKIGTKVMVSGATPVEAYVVETPFYDAMRLRTYTKTSA
jgi:aminomethyltransferase